MDIFLISEANECEFILNQKFILYGKGNLLDKKTKQRKIFHGKIEKNDLDSIKYVIIDSKDYLIC